MTYINDIRTFRQFGTNTVETIQNGIPYFVNQFWTSAQRKSHSIHEISFRACFKAQLPEFFIERLTNVGDTVYDPFMGRGTTIIQSALMDRLPIGNDINPLSIMLARPRLNVPSIQEIQTRLLRIPILAKIDRPELHEFFHTDTLMRLCALKDWFEMRLQNGSFDYVDDWIRMVSMNRLTGHSSGYLSVYTLPPNQAASLEGQKKINAKLNQVPTYRDLTNIVIKKTKTLIKDGIPNPSVGTFLTNEAWNTPAILNSTVDLVVTSPPFLDVVQYKEDNWLRNWFGNIDPTTIAWSQYKNETDWQNMVRKVLLELARVVKSGGHVAFEVGEVRSGKILLEKLVWDAAVGLPFDRIAVIVNEADFTKTAQIWNIDNNSKGTNTNRIVILRRN